MTREYQESGSAVSISSTSRNDDDVAQSRLEDALMGLGGNLASLEKAIAVLKDRLEIVSNSEPYPNKADSELKEGGLDVRSSVVKRINSMSAGVAESKDRLYTIMAQLDI